MDLRVAVSSPSFCKSPELITELQNLKPNTLYLNTDGLRMDEDGLIGFINRSEANILILGTEPFTAKVAASCPGLKKIFKYGVGLDNVDQEALKKHQITLHSMDGVNKRSVSELALCYALGHFRNVFSSVSKMTKGHWDKQGGCELTGKTVGIVGFGHVGEDLARLLQPFRVSLIVHDIQDKSAEVARYGGNQVSYQTLLEKSHVVSFHVPLTNLTQHMLDHSTIPLCKQKPLIINSARGGVISFEDTVKAVKEGILSGLACDVFPMEPFKNVTLTPEEGFYLTPHIGGNSKEAVLAMGRAAISHFYKEDLTNLC